MEHLSDTGLVEATREVKPTNGEMSVLDCSVTSHSTSDVESEMMTKREKRGVMVTSSSKKSQSLS